MPTLSLVFVISITALTFPFSGQAVALVSTVFHFQSKTKNYNFPIFVIG